MGVIFDEVVGEIEAEQPEQQETAPPETTASPDTQLRELQARLRLLRWRTRRRQAD